VHIPQHPGRVAVSAGHAVQVAFLRAHAGLYERTGGRLGHRLIGVPSLMLRTTGRRTGLRRTAVLTYAREGADYVVVASNDGRDRSPGWYVNLTANAAVEVQVARRRSPATARLVEASDPSYPRLWALVNRVNHGRYDGYQRRTTRPIPLAVLSPVGPLR
jgi:deazaflavin-dependent oxidoreductase (nitroreductase family)